MMGALLSSTRRVSAVVFAEATKEFISIQDCHLNANAPTATHSFSLVAIDTANPLAQHGLLRFDIFGEAMSKVPLGAEILSATLTLDSDDVSSTGGNFHRMLVPWNESSTWNSLGAGIQIDGTDAVATPDFVTGPTTVSIMNFNATTSVQAWSDGAPNYGWGVIPTSSSFWSFASSEPASGRQPPKLTINYRYATGPANTLIWKAGFETLLNNGWDEWSFVQAIGTSGDRGPGPTYNFVTEASTLSMTAQEGTRIAQFERLDATDAFGHAKAFKEWRASGFAKTDAFSRSIEVLPDNSVDGIYSAWFYFPSDYVCNVAQWMNLFQFKDQGLDAGSVFHQDPSWWLNVARSSTHGFGPNDNTPIIFPYNWSNVDPAAGQIMLLPRGRWFEVKAELTEGVKIEWYVDGSHLATSLQATHPVGRIQPTFQTWIFGIGHYDGQGKLWVDNVTYRKFPS